MLSVLHHVPGVLEVKSMMSYVIFPARYSEKSSKKIFNWIIHWVMQWICYSCVEIKSHNRDLNLYNLWWFISVLSPLAQKNQVTNRFNLMCEAPDIYIDQEMIQTLHYSSNMFIHWTIFKDFFFHMKNLLLYIESILFEWIFKSFYRYTCTQ